MLRIWHEADTPWGSVARTNIFKDFLRLTRAFASSFYVDFGSGIDFRSVHIIETMVAKPKSSLLLGCFRPHRKEMNLRTLCKIIFLREIIDTDNVRQMRSMILQAWVRSIHIHFLTTSSNSRGSSLLSNTGDQVLQAIFWHVGVTEKVFYLLPTSSNSCETSIKYRRSRSPRFFLTYWYFIKMLRCSAHHWVYI